MSERVKHVQWMQFGRKTVPHTKTVPDMRVGDGKRSVTNVFAMTTPVVFRHHAVYLHFHCSLCLRTYKACVWVGTLMVINVAHEGVCVNMLQAAATHYHNCVPVFYHAWSWETCWQPSHRHHLHSEWHRRQSFQCYIFAIPCGGLCLFVYVAYLLTI